MEDGTEALPRGISHHPDVLRRFLYDRIFEGEWDGQILGPEGDNMTKHGGNFISLKALRDQVLKDIEDLISFMKVPVGENARSAIYHRTPEAKASREGGESGGQSGVKEPFVPQYMPGINSRGYRYVVREEQHPTSQEDDPEAKDSQPSSVNTSKGKSAIPNIFSRATYASPRPAYLPFSEQLTSIESRQPFLEQLRAIESRADSRFGGSSLSNQASEHDNKVKDESADHESSVSSKASPLTTQHTSSPHTAASQHRSSRKATLVASDKDTMDNATLAEILQQPLQPEVRQNIMDANFPNRSQHGAHNFGYQVPPQYQQPSFDRPPGQGFLSATDPTSWSYRPYNQMGYGYQSSYDSAQLPRYPLPQALQYSSQYRPVPMQPAPYPPQTLDYTSLSHGPPPPRSRPGEPRSYWSGEAPARDPAVLALEQGLRELDIGPPPPHRHYGNVAIRPPSSNRVAAYVYRNDPAFQYNGLPQVRGTPAPAPSAPQGNATTSVPSQNQHEWQNRFGLVPATKPDIPVMPFRPGSDDMRPHATPGASSVPYQNLTRNVVPTLEDVRAPEVNPFQEPARDAKPPGWGVLKIGNVSIQSKDRDPQARAFMRPGQRKP